MRTKLREIQSHGTSRAAGRTLLLAALIPSTALLPMASEGRPITIEHRSDLTRLCIAQKMSDQYAMCYAFNTAVLKTMENNAIYGMKACVPPLVNVNNAIHMLVKWLLANRQRADGPASELAAEAYAAAFPYKKSIWTPLDAASPMPRINQ